MNINDHLEKAQRLKATLAKLSDEQDYEMIIETCHAAALHLIACVAERRKKAHLDTHKGLARFLDDLELPGLASLFRELEALRTGRFYGGKGDGKSAKRAKAILGDIEADLH